MDTITKDCIVCNEEFDFLPNAELPKVCDDCIEEYNNCGHECTSRCGNDIDCPCYADHTCKNTPKSLI